MATFFLFVCLQPKRRFEPIMLFSIIDATHKLFIQCTITMGRNVGEKHLTLAFDATRRLDFLTMTCMTGCNQPQREEKKKNQRKNKAHTTTETKLWQQWHSKWTHKKTIEKFLWCVFVMCLAKQSPDVLFCGRYCFSCVRSFLSFFFCSCQSSSTNAYKSIYLGFV